MNARTRFAAFLVLGTALLAALGTLILWLPQAIAAEEAVAGMGLAPEVLKWGYMAAALATGVSSLGAAYAVATSAAAV